MTSINNSYLIGLFGGGATSFLPTAAYEPPKVKQPTPPWSTKVKQRPEDEMVREALAGRSFINEAPVRAGISADYNKLFALHKGLDTLNALTNRAGTKGVSSFQTAQLVKRFSSGLAEIESYLAKTELEGVRLVQGTATSTSKTTAGVQRDSAVSVTTPIHEGTPETDSPAFSGEVVFDITVKRMVGGVSTPTVISIDLNEMGSDTRSLFNVLAHINGKLETAGVLTRLGRELIKDPPKTISVGGKPVTLPAGPDRYALAVRGESTETIEFKAPATSDAVYVVQTSGTGGGHQLLKFQADGSAPPASKRIGETYWVDGRASQSTLPPGVETVRASATGADGSLWLVADLDPGPGNTPIKGQRDVALMKIDSAGRVVSTKPLGAASTASGYAIAVDAEGRVAVAGSVTGALEPGARVEVATVADSFVTVFDADSRELWTQRRGARAADEATAVSFGADGTVYVAGRAQSGMPGASALGGWDGYVQGFKPTQAHTLAPIVGTSTGVQQFGTAADDGVGAVTVDGSNLYSAGVEDGRFIVRRFNLDVDGKPTLVSSRDLGLASGEVAGISVSNGRVILTGTTRNAALSIGSINAAHQGGKDAFVAVLEGDLAVSANDRLTYVGTAGDDTAADVKVAGGKVWISGIADRSVTAKPTDPTKAFLARLDPLTGAVEWRRDWEGQSDQAAPLTLAVASGGASVLDKLGLPQGDIDQTQSKKLTEATSVRVGDRFYVSSADGGRSVAVTIEARDTLATLARKIEQASNRRLKVSISSTTAEAGKVGDPTTALFADFQRLSISARSGQSGAILKAGEPGRDALAGLGLSQGFIGETIGDKTIRTVGLNLPRSLNLSSPDAIKTAGERLQEAMKSVRDAYRALDPATAEKKPQGRAPAYLSAQMANYQAALARLGG